MPKLPETHEVRYWVVCTEVTGDLPSAIERFNVQKVCHPSCSWSGNPASGEVSFRYSSDMTAEKIHAAEEEFRVQLAEANLRIQEPGQPEGVQLS